MPALPSVRLPIRPAAGALAALAAALVLAGAGPADAETKEPDPGPAFTAFEKAWRAQAPEQVVACMKDEGTATWQLLAYPLSGKARAMKPKQAKAMLKAYFKRVSSVKLKDVSPEKSPKHIRLYEYTYKPTGENARTTHLRVQLKLDKNRTWVLASVTESTKPRG